MTDEEKTPDERFEEILAKANAVIRGESNELMDMNHDSIMASREIINELRDFRERYSTIIDNLILAHGVACKEIADLYGDQILSEQGIRQTQEEEETD